MQRKTVISLVETIVVFFVLVYLVVVYLSWLSDRNFAKISHRVICGTNLKDIGRAMMVYADDHEGKFPQLPGTGPWSKNLGFEFDLAKPDFSKGGLHSEVDRTITASLYLLVSEADVSPKSFVCPADRSAKRIDDYDGANSTGRDLVDLWDFGTEPHKHVSYAMHNPYGAYPARNSGRASIAIAGDMSPWMRLGDFVNPVTTNKDLKKNISLLPPYFSDTTITRDQIQQSNAIEHGREGQNVAFADGHSEYCKTTDVGVKHDNIYTYWSASENPAEKDIRIGTNPTARDKDNDAKSADDSFLAI